MITDFTICPADILLRPDMIESCEVLYYCHVINETQYQNLQILYLYSHLKQQSLTKATKKSICEQLKKDYRLPIEEETIRKTLASYYTALPQDVVIALMKKYGLGL